MQTDNCQVTYYEQFIYNKLNEEYLKKYDIQIYDQLLSDNFTNTFGFNYIIMDGTIFYNIKINQNQSDIF